MSDASACLAMANLYIATMYPTGSLRAEVFSSFILVTAPDSRMYQRADRLISIRLISIDDFDKFCATMEAEIDGFAERRGIKKVLPTACR